MAYVKAPIPSEVYHLTKKANLESILDDGAIRRFDDTECWFCESLAKMKAYMEQTVLCEGKPYYGAGGRLCHYPKFEPEQYVILKLTPCRREGNWYRWNQEIPLNSPPELVQVAAEFSKLKIGFRGICRSETRRQSMSLNFCMAALFAETCRPHPSFGNGFRRKLNRTGRHIREICMTEAPAC